MVSRHWNGTTKPGMAERYIQHLMTETVVSAVEQVVERGL